jgi:hypothetical protein
MGSPQGTLITWLSGESPGAQITLKPLAPYAKVKFQIVEKAPELLRCAYIYELGICFLLYIQGDYKLYERLHNALVGCSHAKIERSRLTHACKIPFLSFFYNDVLLILAWLLLSYR